VVRAFLSVLVLLGVLAGCATPAPSPADTGRSFTDDLGHAVTLPDRPLRVAGLTDVVAALWSYGVTPVAAFGFTGISQDRRFTGRDVSGVVELGREYGTIDLEALAAARPDVIVTNAYPVDNAGTIDPNAPLYGFTDLAQQQAAARIAPIVAVTMDGSAVQVVERTERLAAALGADPALIDAGRAEYAAARERLRGVAAAHPVVVAALAAYPADGLYVARPADDPALTSYADLGVRILDLGGPKYYWSTVSWENVGSVKADVVLESQIDPMPAAELLAQPTFATQPAARSGQVYPWIFASMDGRSQAQYIDQLAERIAAAHKVV